MFGKPFDLNGESSKNIRKRKKVVPLWRERKRANKEENFLGILLDRLGVENRELKKKRTK